MAEKHTGIWKGEWMSNFVVGYKDVRPGKERYMSVEGVDKKMQNVRERIEKTTTFMTDRSIQHLILSLFRLLFCTEDLPSSMLTVAHSLVLSVNLLRVCSVPLSISDRDIK